MKTIDVSIIIPCYNAEKYLDKCINSILNQTFKNIEIICINDGSTDNTLKTLEKFKKKDNRIRIINKKNEGASSARNDGIKHSKGFFIMFVDSDDYIDLNMVEIMYKKAIQSKVDIVKCNRFDVYANNEIIIQRKPIWPTEKKIIKKDFPKNVYIEFFKRSRLCNVYMTLIKRELLANNNIYFSNELVVDEDEIFSIQIFEAANSFLYLPQSYYYYVKNTNGLSSGGVDIYDRFKSRKKHIEILKKLSIKWDLKDYNDLLLEKTAFVGIYTAMQTAAKNNKFTKQEQYKLFKKIINDAIFNKSIKKCRKKIMLFPEKILCFLSKYKLYYIGFYYARLFEIIVKKYRFKLEKFRK